MVGICAKFGIPEILQGRAFESTIMRQTLEAFGVEKTHELLFYNECPPNRSRGMILIFNTLTKL